ncbi:DUF1254 domain-containing protein [Sediminicoccus sp. KRV36]|uniref:DUF1254 domain-containing protein n=1 Tax=Sediminicoccus sp. KRV36 TaxID=3133721 RepID=UPI00200F9DD8|nr:DUF1254 domain-containing protein [Sediminicoccus rosea]UPY38838.1 DUF1254 domain-containing protein [Sediminicoccus rosea]
MISKRNLLSGAALAGSAMVLGKAQPGMAQPAPGRPGIIGAAEIAEQALIYGLPIVMNYAVMYEFCVDRSSSQFKAPFNQIYNDARVFTWRDTAIPTPNSDTPYSMCWLDLRAEPMVISVPAVERRRYFSVQLCDGNTYNYGYIGSRTTGNEAGSWLVVGPGWQGTPPPGVKGVFRASTQFGLTIFRTQLFDPADMPNVVAVQAGYRAQPLSAFLGQPAPPAAPAIAWPRITPDLAKHHFLEYLDFALQFAPPQPNEVAIRAQLARIGIGAGRHGDLAAMPLLDRIEMLAGMYEGNRRVEHAVSQAGTAINGWRVSAVPGSMEAYDGNWLLRAVVAKAGIYANTTEEACYPFTREDSTGATLDGGTGRYSITFPAGQLPPINAFWSITMYHGGNQLLVENPINRYLINTPMLPGMKTNPDGSLTIHIQREDPGEALRPNWLPAPNGPIYLVMRLYWPKTEAPSILPIGQGAWRPPAVMRVS